MIASRFLCITLALGLLPFLLACFLPDQAYLLSKLGLSIDLLILISIIVDWFLTPDPANISPWRQVPERLSIGRTNKVILHIANNTTYTLSIRVRDDFPQAFEANCLEFKFAIGPRSILELPYTVKPSARGEFAFGSINIAYLSRFKLFWRQQAIASPRTVKVFSDLQALHELSLKLKCSNEISDFPGRSRGQGTEFASLRDYSIGDDCRLVDWKATARRGRPIVRNFETDEEQSLICLVDAGRLMASDLDGLPRFEHALNSALSLVMTGLARNDQVGLGVFADKPLLYMPPRRGRSYFKKVLEAVATVSPKPVEPDYGRMLSYFGSLVKSRALMVVLTDLSDVDGSSSLLSGLLSLTPPHLPFCVALKDAQVEALAQAKCDDVDQVFRRTVAIELASARELARSVLQRRGCLVLDCPPKEMSSALVNRYLEIKARGLL